MTRSARAGAAGRRAVRSALRMAVLAIVTIPLGATVAGATIPGATISGTTLAAAAAPGAVTSVARPAPHSRLLTTVADPEINIAPSQTPENFLSPAYCHFGASVDNSRPCTDAALDDINYAHRIEGVPPITLPPNWYSLTVAQQLLTVFNLERAAFGLPVMAGLAAPYDVDAANGAAHEQDPVLEQGSGVVLIGGVLAVGDPNALAADFGLMYDDGWGGIPADTPNADCTSVTADGCWGHRHNILLDCRAEGVNSCQYVGGAAQADVAFGPFGLAPSFAAAIYGTTGPLPSLDWPFPPSEGGPATCTGPSIDHAVGYWLAGADGAVYSCGTARNFGSLTAMGITPSQPIVGIAATPDGRGYWLVARDGGLFAFGDAAFYGSMGGRPLDAPIVGMTATPEGGYYEVATDGGIFSFGPGATFLGSMGGKPLNRTVVGIAVDPTGGYYEVASDGGIFSFGAPFHGSTGCLPLTQPIVAMIVSPDATGVGGATACGFTSRQRQGGYQFVAGDGGVFTFGDAGFAGSLGGEGLTDVVGMANS